MKSKFILSGGGIGGCYTQDDVLAYREATSYFPQKVVHILSIAFASLSIEMGDTAYEYMNSGSAMSIWRTLSFVNPHKTFRVESAKLEDIETQIENADVIAVHGGNGDWLQHHMSKVNDLANLVAENKVILGGSAGTNMWSHSYYSNDNNAVCDGMKVIPYHTFCHYNSSKWDRLNMLIEAKTDYPVIPLRDEEWITL